MSKSYDKVEGKKVREQYFRSERVRSAKKKGLEHGVKRNQGHSDTWQKKWNEE